MRLLFLLICVVSLNVVSANAQITVNEEPNISRMMAVYAGGIKPTTNVPIPDAPNVRTIDGFRIQLMATTDRRKVDEALAQFGGRYPGVFSTWSQAAPYYRVRIGGFAARTEATNYLNRIKKDYPDAYIVPDKVKTSEITQ
jgi:SPOR domain